MLCTPPGSRTREPSYLHGYSNASNTEATAVGSPTVDAECLKGATRGKQEQPSNLPCSGAGKQQF